MSQNLQIFVKFQKFQLENLVDFEKCCKTHIFLQKSEPIQPKTSNILPNFASVRRSTTRRATTHGRRPAPRGGLVGLRFFASSLREVQILFFEIYSID